MTTRNRFSPEVRERAVPAALIADDQAWLNLLEGEVKELRRANEILRTPSAYLRWRSSTATADDDGVN